MCWAQADMHEDWKAQQDRIEADLRRQQELDAAMFEPRDQPVEYWDWPEHYGRA